MEYYKEKIFKDLGYTKLENDYYIKKVNSYKKNFNYHVNHYRLDLTYDRASNFYNLFSELVNERDELIDNGIKVDSITLTYYNNSYGYNLIFDSSNTDHHGYYKENKNNGLKGIEKGDKVKHFRSYNRYHELEDDYFITIHNGELSFYSLYEYTKKQENEILEKERIKLGLPKSNKKDIFEQIVDLLGFEMGSRNLFGYSSKAYYRDNNGTVILTRIGEKSFGLSSEPKNYNYNDAFNSMMDYFNRKIKAIFPNAFVKIWRLNTYRSSYGKSDWATILELPSIPKTFEEVKMQYKKMAILHHPDRGGNTQKMQQINDAYEQAKSYFGK